ncbi:glycoside hydrolase family 5 protein [Apiospora saccharicola]|uniref:Glycoside hydrolase family 5 protein n=1 Tax=Apiospora saccharicola TaxID=335842 RepID=A0ABR1UGT3_9PEZI
MTAADEMDEAFAAQDLSAKALGGSPIRAQDGHFVDGYGRTLSLRGLNVSGASKLPTEPNGLSHLTEGFYDRHRTVTFKGRPFPLEEAPLHFQRLRAWGLTLVRLLVTWEALGHAGPNPETDLDGDYINYLRDLIAMMPEYGIKCFICGHQDVWSRFSGGSGAPGWTFEAAGLDIAAFTETGAAYVHGQDEARRRKKFLENGGKVDPREPSGPFVWPSGYQKLAASTMATLFWAGDALAPKLMCRRTPIAVVPGSSSNEKKKKTSKEEEVVSVQTFLQEAFIEAFGRLADAVGHLEACVGFDPMNEPHRGLVNLHGFHAWDYNTDLHIGHCPSLAQSLALGSGYVQNVPFYVKSWPHPTRKSHDSVVDPKGRSVWLESVDVGIGKEDVDWPRGMGRCVWKSHGVWSWDEKKKVAVIHDDDYFERDHRPGREGERLEWYRDCWAPFLLKFSERVSRGHPQHLSFLEPIPNEFMPPWEGKEEEEGDDPRENASQKYATKTVIATKRPQNLVYAPHFYDLNVLFSKAHGLMSVNVQGLSRGMFVLKALYFGEAGLRVNYQKQIGNILAYGRKSLGKAVPALIGEVGISFDINDRHAFATGDYDMQRQLMHGLVSAMEDNHVAFTLWNYNPDNRVAYGDGWNKEDFSVVNGDHHDGDADAPPPDYRNRSHEKDELYRGGRVLDVIIRPYAAKVAGTPVRSEWDHRTLRFSAVWRTTSSSHSTVHNTSKKALQTEIFLPDYHYKGHELDIATSHGLESHLDQKRQTLYVWSTHKDAEAYAKAGTHYVMVEIRDVQKRLRERVLERRAAGFSNGLIQRLPLDVEVWLEESMSFGQGAAMGLFLLGLLGALLAFVSGMV